MRLSRDFVRSLEKFVADDRHPSRERVAMAQLLVQMHLADETTPAKLDEPSPALKRILETMK